MFCRACGFTFKSRTPINEHTHTYAHLRAHTNTHIYNLRLKLIGKSFVSFRFMANKFSKAALRLIGQRKLAQLAKKVFSDTLLGLGLLDWLTISLGPLLASSVALGLIRSQPKSCEMWPLIMMSPRTVGVLMPNTFGLMRCGPD